MSHSSATLPNLHQSCQESKLSQLCGSDQLLRDRYKVLRVLGRGGFGVTFLARDASLPGAPLCVIKQLCPKVNNPVALDRAKRRFWREAKTLSQLGSHAQIPLLLDYFTKDGEFYLVQEYVRGTTLTREVRRSGPLSEFAVKRFLREILPVLQYIHQNRVIHRDIKPPNIIRCRDDDRLVLIDFGAVKDELALASEMPHKAATTQFIGTVGFAPPEQVALRPTYASDIYAVGVTCLFLLTGKTPLEFDYDQESGEISWRSSVYVSDHFAKILDKMLRTSLQERYQTVDEVLRALDLEPHVHSLAQCMNTLPKPGSMPHSTSSQAGFASDYLTPTQRTAIQIREWRSRNKSRQKQSPKRLAYPTMPL